MDFNKKFDQFNGSAEPQWVMVFEKAGSNLEVRKGEDNKYVLEGIFAQFGVENNNHRVYEEADYLPHLEYLNEKISKRRLLGELDHPEKFDISLNNASHIIESLVYDKPSRQLKGRIRILDTPKGQIAKTLVDAGVPLSISSRAAGVVKENKKVNLRRIFTYDIVIDPGFKEAQLSQVNESILSGFGSILNENESFFSNKGLVAELDFMNESFGLSEDSNTKIFNINPTEKELASLLEGEKNTTSTMDNKNFVTVEDMHNYSLVIKNEIQKIKESLENISKPTTIEESTDKDNLIKELSEKVATLEGYIQYIAENLDKNVSYVKYLAESVDKNISYTKYSVEELDKNITYVKYLAENLDTAITENNNAKAELEKAVGYIKYVAENLDTTISHNNYLTEELNTLVAYGEYLKENIENITPSNVSEAPVVETKEEDKEEVKATKEEESKEEEKVEETIAPIVAVTEAVEIKEEKIEEKVDYKNLSSHIKSLIETVKKQKTDSFVMEQKHAFFNVLSESNKQAFLTLDETKKQKVSKSINEGAWFTEEEVLNLWNQSLAESNATPKFISEMPAKYVPIWESLNEGQRNQIVAQGKLQILETAYQIKNFWETRQLNPVVGLQPLTESNTAEKNSEKTTKLGYSNEYIKNIGKQLKNRF